MKEYLYIISIQYYSNLYINYFLFSIFRQTYLIYAFFFLICWKSTVFLLKITLFPVNGVKGITSIGCASIETIFSPHTILRNARPRSQERVRTRVGICPGVPHEQCHPYPDHVAQKISTDRRKPEHGLVPSSSNGNTPSFPALEDARQLDSIANEGVASATFGIRCAHPFKIFRFSHLDNITR